MPTSDKNSTTAIGFQSGGMLGAYQAGVYKALAKYRHTTRPDRRHFYWRNHHIHGNLAIFQADLFSARGTKPKTLADVAQREKDVRYSSRTRVNTEMQKEPLRTMLRTASLLNSQTNSWPILTRSFWTPAVHRARSLLCI